MPGSGCAGRGWGLEEQDPASEKGVSSAGSALAGIHVTVTLGGAVTPDWRGLVSGSHGKEL